MITEYRLDVIVTVAVDVVGGGRFPLSSCKIFLFLWRSFDFDSYTHQLDLSDMSNVFHHDAVCCYFEIRIIY